MNLEPQNKNDDQLEKEELTEEELDQLIQLYREVVWETLQIDNKKDSEIFHHPV